MRPGVALAGLALAAALDASPAAGLTADVEQAITALPESAWDEWERLLFYYHPYVGRPHGLFDGGTDARAALRDFAAGLQAGRPLACAYPRRYRWAKRHLPLAGLPDDPRCPELATFLEELPHDHVTLVYSAQYLGNPASFFGHTFLVFGRGGGGQPLLDPAVGFTARNDSTGPLDYLYRGLTGGFGGGYQILPYFAKVEEYNNHERRDLWEYRLPLTPAQVTDLELSLWEVQAHTTPYYYFDVNCSTMVLKLLETVDPELGAGVDRRLWVSPLWAARDVVEAAHASPTYRPSIHTQVTARYEALTPDERAIVRDAVDANALDRRTLPASPERRAAVLDTVVDFVDYDEKLAGSKTATVHATLRHDALVERAKLAGVKTPEIPPPPQGGVHLAHREHLVEYGGGREAAHPYQRLYVRPMYHASGESDAGLGGASDLELLATDVRQELAPTRRWRLHRFDLLHLASRPPSSGLIGSMAWETVLGATEEPGEAVFGRTGELAGRIGAGFGKAFALTPSWLVYGLGRVAAGSFVQARQPYASAGGELGLSAAPLPRLRVVGSVAGDEYGVRSRQGHFLVDATLTFHVLLGQDLHLVAYGAQRGAVRDLGLGLGVYF